MQGTIIGTKRQTDVIACRAANMAIIPCVLYQRGLTKWRKMHSNVLSSFALVRRLTVSTLSYSRLILGGNVIAKKHDVL